MYVYMYVFPDNSHLRLFFVPVRVMHVVCHNKSSAACHEC